MKDMAAVKAARMKLEAQGIDTDTPHGFSLLNAELQKSGSVVPEEASDEASGESDDFIDFIMGNAYGKPNTKTGKSDREVSATNSGKNAANGNAESDGVSQAARTSTAPTDTVANQSGKDQSRVDGPGVFDDIPMQEFMAAAAGAGVSAAVAARLYKAFQSRKGAANSADASTANANSASSNAASPNSAKASVPATVDPMSQMLAEVDEMTGMSAKSDKLAGPEQAAQLEAPQKKLSGSESSIDDIIDATFEEVESPRALKGPKAATALPAPATDQNILAEDTAAVSGELEKGMRNNGESDDVINRAKEIIEAMMQPDEVARQRFQEMNITADDIKTDEFQSLIKIIRNLRGAL